ncbi:hypothetical protein CEXT_368131 [Caerostris extrusa]|uniref:Uncharacterized protein n=1 Tax=Caerostris extrusa TaxID=172846 RepID=A0AAV4UT37_CAEEX|nr:hypothetical protein CEXT_368131 [Caerostris extrusa]
MQAPGERKIIYSINVFRHSILTSSNGFLQSEYDGAGVLENFGGYKNSAQDSGGSTTAKLNREGRSSQRFCCCWMYI